MIYARILKGTSLILLASSIYFAAQQNTIYFTLIFIINTYRICPT